MISIAPTITTDDSVVYKRQIEKLSRFAVRVHIDLADGEFAPTKLTPIDEVWWPGNMQADVHVMFANPFEHIEAFIAMHPELVIVHAEAEGDFITFAEKLHAHGIKVGVALLPLTSAETIVPALEHIDHVLIFGGKLGYQGGKADLKNLKKVLVLRKHKPQLEIGWDGGINNTNVARLVAGGIDVLNVGGYIAKAVNPLAAYVTLQALAVMTEKRLDERDRKKEKRKKQKIVKEPKQSKKSIKSNKKSTPNEHSGSRTKSQSNT